LETAVTVPGLPAIVPSVRRFVRGILVGSPRIDDMELITAPELQAEQANLEPTAAAPS